MKRIGNFISSLVYLGIEESMPFNTQRNIQIINIVALLLLLISIVFTIPILFAKNMMAVAENIGINLLTFIPALGVLFLNRNKYYLFARFFVFFYFSVFLIGLPILTGRESGSQLHYSVLMATSLLIFERKLSILITFIPASILFIVGSYLAGINNPLSLIFDPISFAINTVSAIILFYFSVNAFKIESQKFQQQIVVKNKELSFKNKQIHESITYAERIQQALLPDPMALNTIFPEYFILFQPKDVVSGDFYWFQEIEGGWIIAVGDCTGHGVPGSMMSMLGISFLEHIVMEKNISRPDLILAELDAMIRKTLKQEQTDNQDGMDIALCAVYFENKEIFYSGANNPLLILNGQGIQEIRPTKKGVGGRKKNQATAYELHKITYEKNTMIYLFSDGFKDQFGGIESKKFTPTRFRDMIQAHASFPLEEQKKKISKILEDWIQQGKEEQIDDITLLGLKIL